MPQLTEKRMTRELRRDRLLRWARPTPSFAARPKAGISARAVGSYVPGLTRSAFEKHGFAAASLITEWAKIVGAEFASFTEPERLKWPQPRRSDAAGDEPGVARPAATLVLRVDPARALDAEYKARLIMDRVNTYFGYRAVAEVRIVQAAPSVLPRSHQLPQTPREAGVRRAGVDQPLPGIEDPALAIALGRLKAGLDAAAK